MSNAGCHKNLHVVCVCDNSEATRSGAIITLYVGIIPTHPGCEMQLRVFSKETIDNRPDRRSIWVFYYSFMNATTDRPPTSDEMHRYARTDMLH